MWWNDAALNVVPTARIAIDHQIDMTGMNNSILAADNEGTGTEFLWGFLMGLLLGVFMLLMVRSWYLAGVDDAVALTVLRVRRCLLCSCSTAPCRANRKWGCCSA